ncbi:unnamed protein product [Schistosoma margrebowiei]|uniref:Uncharacterized protein n=1 Tax=Schistosoma margrebowiei TaxID=48269 RepID=A0A183MQ25_9TREM|nr:unnamed protein product [Schistosoma margrebowiei]
MNKPDSLNPPDIEAAPIDLPKDVTLSTAKEIRTAIKQILNIVLPTKSRHCGSSSTNQLNGISLYTSTSFTMRRRSTVWILEHCNNVLDTMMYVAGKTVNIIRNSYDALKFKAVYDD